MLRQRGCLEMERLLLAKGTKWHLFYSTWQMGGGGMSPEGWLLAK